MFLRSAFPLVPLSHRANGAHPASSRNNILPNGPGAGRGEALCCHKEVRHGMHMLPASECPARELQRHAGGDLSRMLEVLKALRLRVEGEASRVCPTEAGEMNAG